jgi:divalent metal cation (Fe/Co/Zn/Cd) transporter
MSAFDDRLPPAEREALARARRLELLWIGALLTISIVMFFAVGSSQAMKTAWIEDLLSFVPPAAFLLATWVEGWPPTDRFPLGFIRVTSIAYLVSATALTGVGLFLLIDSAHTLVTVEKPTIGSIRILGVTFWFGWLMIAALLYSAALPAVFGRLKLRPARALHDKILYADALMNKADWLTAVAGVGGILGIGMGWWWADAAAAIVIAADVLHDGVKHTGAAMRDLSDEMPRTVDDSGFDPLIGAMRARVRALPWVAGSDLRLREEGRFLTGTVDVVPKGGDVSAARVAEAERALAALHWRVRGVTVRPVTQVGQPTG